MLIHCSSTICFSGYEWIKRDGEIDRKVRWKRLDCHETDTKTNFSHLTVLLLHSTVCLIVDFLWHQRHVQVQCLLEHNTICLVPYLTTHAWNCSLFLFHKTLQPYKKGHLPGSALMRQIAKQLPWCSPQDKIEQFSRPDIFDNKTADWLEVTAHSKELNRI